jgi:hypothetical protein
MRCGGIVVERTGRPGMASHRSSATVPRLRVEGLIGAAPDLQYFAAITPVFETRLIGLQGSGQKEPHQHLPILLCHSASGSHLYPPGPASPASRDSLSNFS